MGKAKKTGGRRSGMGKYVVKRGKMLIIRLIE